MTRLLFALLIAAAPLVAPADPKTAEGPCLTEEYRQFDFWLGEWDVFDPRGKKVGENRVTKLLSGCGLQEQWQSSQPNMNPALANPAGTSLNIFDRGTRQWHQTWIDNGGLLLRLEGGLDDSGRMVLSGSGYDPRGKQFLSRISWTPMGANIRQLWEVSADQGGNWQVLFDGTYKPKVHP